MMITVGENDARENALLHVKSPCQNECGLLVAVAGVGSSVAGELGLVQLECSLGLRVSVTGVALNGTLVLEVLLVTDDL